MIIIEDTKQVFIISPGDRILKRMSINNQKSIFMFAKKVH